MNDTMNGKSDFQFEISLSVLNHLGRNLYRNFITVLGEAISNAWDAEAENIYITIDREKGYFVILDDGAGMSADDFKNKFLKIGYSKRKEFGLNSNMKGRPFMGAKGIGKLALLSCADEITIASRTLTTEVIGGKINNNQLDVAIDQDLTPQEYPLELYDEEIVQTHMNQVSQGTLIYFSGTKEKIRHTVEYIRKQVALYFRFSLVDPNFNIFINNDLISFGDISKLSDASEFLWIINELNDPYLDQLYKLKAPIQNLSSTFNIEGFIATVDKPSDVKILGADEKVGIDLFVNGRLRERDIVKHIPTNRLVESYWYGQIHYNSLDNDGIDRFTSSREGIKSEDDLFQGLLAELKTNLLNKVLDQWDKLRLNRGEDGDDENETRKSKKERRARSLFHLTAQEYTNESSDQIEIWIKELLPDAEFNVPTYVDCYISENLIRKFINCKNIPLTTDSINEIKTWKPREEKRKKEANITFSIRQNDDDLSYLGMNYLAKLVKDNLPNDSIAQALMKDSTNYRPVRNAVGHTGLVTQDGKSQLKLVFENIRAKLKILIK